jgi:hypothetical protein
MLRLQKFGVQVHRETAMTERACEKVTTEAAPIQHVQQTVVRSLAQ